MDRQDCLSSTYGSKPTILTGAPDPPPIFTGNATIHAPRSGRRSTLAMFSSPGTSLAAAMRAGTPVDHGPLPADHSAGQITLQTGVVMDNPPAGRSFGDVLTAPAQSYARGSTVTAEFVTGHPKNNLRRGGTFLEVQRQVDGHRSPRRG